MAITVAGIDCGTNSIRLMIARADDYQSARRGDFKVIVPRIMRVVRLGEGVDIHHEFSQPALKRVFDAVDEFSEIIAEHDVDVVRFVATSATRDAKNRAEFENYIEAKLGVKPDVISGVEEARLSFLGAASVVDTERFDAPYLVVDLGGGSTELVLGGAQGTEKFTVQAAFSMDIGSVRMTERHGLHDAPGQAAIEEAIRDIDEHIAKAARAVPLERVHTIIGVSGTVTTMTAVALGQEEYDQKAIDGTEITINDVIGVNDTVVRMSRAQRDTLSVVHPGRRDVIGGGALVWSRVLLAVQKAAYHNGYEINSYVASEHGLLDGIVRDLLIRSAR